MSTPTESSVTGIDGTLAERGSRYGDFRDHAKVTQAIKRAMEIGRNWPALPDDMRECLEMVAHKVGRILNGDPDYLDSWHDIIGYVRLVEKRLETAAALDAISDDRIYHSSRPANSDPALGGSYASRID